MAVTWNYGITTVPQRADNLLAQTVASLAKSGFDEPMIFMDGLPEESNAPKINNALGVVLRWPPVGQLANWINCLINIYLVNPKAQRYAVFEDDLVCCSNLRAYLEACPYPRCSYLNLLTHDENLVGTGGIEGWHLSNQKGRGAVAIVFDNCAIRRLLSAPEFINNQGTQGCRSADGMIINILKPLDYVEYIHYPSLVQHKGAGLSTLGHNYGEMKGFFGEDYDPLHLLK